MIGWPDRRRVSVAVEVDREAGIGLPGGGASRVPVGIGTSTTATFGFERRRGERSVRFSATRRTTLSPFSISGRNDQR
jgi:hypothetical protein